MRRGEAARSRRWHRKRPPAYCRDERAERPDDVSIGVRAIFSRGRGWKSFAEKINCYVQWRRQDFVCGRTLPSSSLFPAFPLPYFPVPLPLKVGPLNFS